jgi:hypothetical protein
VTVYVVMMLGREREPEVILVAQSSPSGTEIREAGLAALEGDESAWQLMDIEITEHTVVW